MHIPILIYTSTSVRLALLYCIHVSHLLLANNNNNKQKKTTKSQTFPLPNNQSQTIQPTPFSN